MENKISLKGEDVIVEAGISYYVIDALYLNEIKTSYEELRVGIDQDIKDKVFPYTDAPFAKFTPINNTFQIQNIRKANHHELASTDENYFSCDTGLLILIKSSLLLEIIMDYEYDDLVDSLTEDVNLSYWKKLTDGMELQDSALILAPGVSSGFQFEGSGLYKLIL